MEICTTISNCGKIELYTYGYINPHKLKNSQRKSEDSCIYSLIQWWGLEESTLVHLPVLEGKRDHFMSCYRTKCVHTHLCACVGFGECLAGA